jgi:hypothetical protein
MGPEKLRDCMDLLGWTSSTLAAQLECDRVIVTRWMNGTSTTDVPPAIAEWITQRADAAMMLPVPPPTVWRASTAGVSYTPGSATIH